MDSQLLFDDFKLWLTDDGVEQFRRAAGSRCDVLVIQFGAYVGLHAFEMPQIQPRHVKRASDSDDYRLKISHGRDTDTGEAKPRDAYLPFPTGHDLYQFARDENLDDKPYVDLTSGSIRAAVRRTAEAAADRTGDDSPSGSSSTRG